MWYPLCAEEMYNEVIENADSADIIIMAAAVADYRSKNVSDQKIKNPIVIWK